MNCCCSDSDFDSDSADARPPFNPTRWRRVAKLMQWAVPCTTLALVPKCPACFAAYVLLVTGIGLSVPAATAMRWTLIVVSLAALGYLLVGTIRRALMRAAPGGV